MLPNHVMRSPCSAQVDYNEGERFLEVTVSLLEVEGGFNEFVKSYLYIFCNTVNHQVNGVQLVYHQDSDGDESLMLSSSGFVPERDEGLEEILELTLNRLEKVTKALLPVIITFVTQKPVLRFAADGSIYFARLSVSLNEAFNMMMLGNYGRA